MRVIDLVLAFAGGVYGSLVGGTISFIFTGLLALIGIAVSLSGGPGYISEIAFGPFFGPHTAFVGAVAGAAYAGKLGIDLDGDEFAGNDTGTPLYVTKNVKVLLVSGVFAVFGYLINYLFESRNLPMDTIAAAVAICGVLTRVVIAKDSVIYKEEVESNYLFDSVWAGALALLTALTVELTGINNIGWAVSVVSLSFLFSTVRDFPITHHITMAAGFAQQVYGNIYVTILFGIGSALLGNILNKYTNTNRKSHIDMPAIVITISSLLTLPFAK